MNDKIRVVIADDHPLVRQGLEVVLGGQRDIELVGQACDGVEAVEVVLETKPDVVLMDLKMPGQDGLTAISAIREVLPETRFIILTSFTEDERVLEAVKAGAMGFLTKESDHFEVLSAIRAVSRGEGALHPSAARALMHSYKAASPPTVVDALTQTELKVLQLLAHGQSNRELAAALGVSVRTVTTHVRNILDKLQLENRTQAALYARDHGLITPRK